MPKKFTCKKTFLKDKEVFYCYTGHKKELQYTVMDIILYHSEPKL